MNDRKEYAYLLCIGGKILKIIAKWWSTPQEMTATTCGMATVARTFRKSGACWSMSDSAETSGSSQSVVRYALALIREKSSSQRTTRLYINPYYRTLLKRQNYGKLL